MALTEIAYAKINLALHVRRRRPDGYHELETLFAFVDDGDRLTARETVEDSLTVTGEFAAQLGDPFGNIASKALTALPRAEGMAVSLEKRLPIAAGLGGGSADAGAVFRLVERTHGLPGDWAARAARLGADVPACVESRSCIGRGTGIELEALDNDLAGTQILLVNPRVPLSTTEVFAAWDGVDRGELPQGSLSSIAAGGRNDLETPAISLCPAIADVLTALNRTDAFLVRMSGSGATCYGLFRSDDAMFETKSEISSNHPEWWTMTGDLR